jgi:hypothetical protein
MESTGTDNLSTLTHNQGVVGSCPTGPTLENKPCRIKDRAFQKTGKGRQRPRKVQKGTENTNQNTNQNGMGVPQ